MRRKMASWFSLCLYCAFVLFFAAFSSKCLANETEIIYFAENTTPDVIISLENPPESKNRGVPAETPDKTNNGGSAFGDLPDPFAAETPQYPAINDPFEGFNRAMYKVNDAMYHYFFKPVSTAYRDIVPEDARLSIKNAFDNASSPVNLVSSALQGDVDKVVRTVGRFLLNTIVGIGGLFDVAKYYEIEPVNEDFEQALGSYGTPAGPYIVLPFFGPSSGRNIVGKAVDTFLSPTWWFSPSFLVGAGITTEDTVNSTSFRIDDIDALEKDAVDPYVSQRDFFHQYREGKIRK